MMHTEHSKQRPSHQVVAAVIRENKKVFAAQRDSVDWLPADAMLMEKVKLKL